MIAIHTFENEQDFDIALFVMNGCKRSKVVNGLMVVTLSNCTSMHQLMSMLGVSNIPQVLAMTSNLQLHLDLDAQVLAVN